MSLFTLIKGSTAVMGAVYVVIGVMAVIRGRLWRRSDVPPRAVRCGGVAVMLFGTSLLLGSVPDLVGLRSLAVRLPIATVNFFVFVPLVFGLFIYASIVAGRARRAPGPAQIDPSSGQ